MGPATSSTGADNPKIAGVLGRMCEQALVILLELWKSGVMSREESDSYARTLFRAWSRSLAKEGEKSKERLAAMLTAALLSGITTDVGEMERVIRELEDITSFLWGYPDLSWLLVMVSLGSGLARAKALELTSRCDITLLLNIILILVCTVLTRSLETEILI